MPVFEVFIEDDRYAARILSVERARDEAHARRIAEAILRKSEHYIGVEVRLSSNRLFGIGSLDDWPASRFDDRFGDARAR